MSKLTEKIPSFVWLLIIVGGFTLFIGAILGGFYAITHIEGVGSLILLIAGWSVFRVGNNSPDFESSNLGIAVGISFFALMGIALDQTGNFIYNQPLEWIFCPTDTVLTREVIRRGARGGGISISQNFSCVAKNGGQILRTISGWEHFIFRFFEYVLLGYILLGSSRIYTRIKGGFSRK